MRIALKGGALGGAVTGVLGAAPRRVAVALVTCVALARPAAAQIEIVTEGLEDEAQAAYFAITSTPLGGLPSWVAYQLGGLGGPGFGLRGHYGYIDEEGPFSRRTFGFGTDFSLGRGVLGLTAGYHDVACDEDELEGEIGGASLSIECGGGFVLGANMVAPVVRSPLGSSGSTTFVLGVDASLGYGSGEIVEVNLSDTEGNTLSVAVDASSVSGALGIPLVVVARTGGVTLVPHLTPRVAYGRVSLELDTNVPGEVPDDASESGIRFMIGGGLGILFDRSGFGFDVGFQKVFVEDGKTMLGLGLRYVVR